MAADWYGSTSDAPDSIQEQALGLQGLVFRGILPLKMRVWEES